MTPTRKAAAKVRCEMTGRLAHDAWKHLTKRLNIDERYRCTKAATLVSSGGTRFCAACAKHMIEWREAEIRIAKQQLRALRTAKRLPRNTRAPRGAGAP